MPQKSSLRIICILDGIQFRNLPTTDCYNQLLVIFVHPLVVLRPNASQGLLILEVSISHTTTHQSRQDFSGRVINSSHRPLPENTQQSQQKNIHEHDGIRTHNLGRGVAADIRLRPRGYWDRLSFSIQLILKTFHYIAVKEIDISPCEGESFLLCFCCLIGQLTLCII